ncbi:uncharacterized protein CPUR_08532 [Claviceps purpurea 20.1]|uniref:Uncharacterized protein n=1 Tax=Claviceps purpurea (strain 20.1) TaxID=1111077 RepID=M1WIJ7_CLAP2|nr:uncharacterized protein CPUR_08532 [Claviceps purpurea 20.1]
MSGPTSHPWAPKCIVFQLSLLVDPNDRSVPSTIGNKNNSSSSSSNNKSNNNDNSSSSNSNSNKAPTKKFLQIAKDNHPVPVPSTIATPAPSLPLPLPISNSNSNNKDNITRGWSSTAQNVPNPSPPAQALLQRVQKKDIRVGIVRDQSEVQNVVQAIGVIPWLVLFVGAAPAHQRPPPGPLKRKDTMRTLWLPPVVWEGGRRSGAVRLVEDAIKQYL